MSYEHYDKTYESAHDKTVKYWLDKIEAEEKEHKDFREEATDALDCYEKKKVKNKETVFPIYTANVNILHAALFSKMPSPDVRRPHQDRGDKTLAKAIQRSIEHLQDTEDYSLPAHRAVTEWLAGGLGVVWYRYGPEIIEMPIMEPVLDEFGQPVLDPETGEPVMEAMRDEDGKLITEPSIESQTITQEYHPWNRFRWEPAVVWEDVDWISFDHIKTAAQIKKDYGVKLNNLHDKNKDVKAASSDTKHGHVVHNIWDKKKRKVIVLTPAHKTALEEYDDPLGLEGFYPMPRPLMMNVKSGEITPRPDYEYIKTQSENIQSLTKRINALTNGIKDIGFYDASLFEDLAQLENAQDGKYIPLQNMMEKLNGNSSDNVYVQVDMLNKVQVLDRMRAQREDEKNIIYELQGIADIIRGASAASETATAQAIKDKHFQVRLSEKINELRRYWRESYRIVTEMIAEHFTPESFFAMSGVELNADQLAALKNELGREYMIDVETVDTTFEDDAEQRQQGIDLIRVMGEIIGQHLPAVQQGALPADIFTSMLTFGTNLFKQGAVLEDGIASLPDTMQQMGQLQQTMQQMQQQLEQQGQQMQQMGAENQGLQQQLTQVNQAEEARENAKTSADVQSKAAKSMRDQAEAQQTAVETATGRF